MALALMAAAVVAIAAVPASAAEGACSLSGGIVVNGSDTIFIRADEKADAAQIGPVATSIPPGFYDVTLESYDTHHLGGPVQANERWYIEARNGSNVVYTSKSIADLPENVDTLQQKVGISLSLPAITSITFKHAAYPNDDPNSLFALCVSFVKVPTPSIGLVDPATGIWNLRDSTGKEKSFYYGNPGDSPFMGDWNCDGTETPGLYRQSDGYAYLRNSNTQGNADVRFYFGNPGDVPIAGDFNNDGCDTLSLYRPSEARFYIINKLGSEDKGLGAADYWFNFGDPGDKPVVGDWDGDGIDEIGLHRESTGFFYYRNTLTTGIASNQFYFGNPGDRFVSGDWGVIDGVDTPAVFRPSNTTFYFRYSLTQGNANAHIVWGAPSFLPVAGEFKLP